MFHGQELAKFADAFQWSSTQEALMLSGQAPFSATVCADMMDTISCKPLVLEFMCTSCRHLNHCEVFGPPCFLTSFWGVEADGITKQQRHNSGNHPLSQGTTAKNVVYLQYHHKFSIYPRGTLARTQIPAPPATNQKPSTSNQTNPSWHDVFCDESLQMRDPSRRTSAND